MLRRRAGDHTRQPSRGCLAVLGVALVFFGVQGLLTGHFTYFGKRRPSIELHGFEAIVGSCSFLLWAVGCLLMLLPEFQWRKPLAWTALLGGLVFHFAAPVIG